MNNEQYEAVWDITVDILKIISVNYKEVGDSNLSML